MSQTIYKIWQANRTEAWHQLDTATQQHLHDQIDQALEKVGGKRIGLYITGWSNEQWQATGIEEFPSLEALQEFDRVLYELNWSRYSEARSTLGIGLG